MSPIGIRATRTSCKIRRYKSRFSFPGRHIIPLNHSWLPLRSAACIIFNTFKLSTTHRGSAFELSRPAVYLQSSSIYVVIHIKIGSSVYAINIMGVKQRAEPI